MSTRIGTLTPAPLRQPIWLAAVLAVAVAGALTIVAGSVEPDRGGRASPVADIEALRAQAAVDAHERSWTAALQASYGSSVTGTGSGLVRIAEATAANTPTELSGGILGTGFGEASDGGPTGRRGVVPKVPTVGGRAQPIFVNGEACGQCR